MPDPGRAERLETEYLRIVEADDARPTDGRGLRTLLDGTGHDLAFIRHASVRALGRLEEPDLVGEIARLLDDPSPKVRRSAANALAQAFHTSDDASRAADLLLQRVDVEADPGVRGTLARSLGRMAMDRGRRQEVAGALVEMSRDGDGDAAQVTLLGVALGLQRLVRSHPEDGVSLGVARRLQELARYPTRLADDPDPARIRALALDALGLSGRIDVPLLRSAIRDRSPGVGATAARYLAAIPPAQRPELLRLVIGSPLLQTTLQGFLELVDLPRTSDNCRYLFAGAARPTPDVYPVPGPIAVAAMDGLARPCPDLDTQRSLLGYHAGSLGDDDHPWQVASHALVSLAMVAPEDAARLLPIHATHPNPFVRAYAARAAGALGATALLRSLIGDVDPNVRTASVSALFALEGHDVDDVLIAQLRADDTPIRGADGGARADRARLRADDPQLVLTAAGLLEGTPAHGEAAEAAMDAFDRISAAERETWRDPRLALLTLIHEAGDESLAPRLEPYLEDYDAVVADRVADILGDWTGEAYLAAPRPLPPSPLPSVDELDAMDGAHVLLHMEGGGTIDIELHPYLAPTNVYRFWRLVREGYFDGLTFHRWAPNFVIQGGSPGANEYQGAASYSRDEVGLRPHWRGTVGISTRGHDTGDAQIFINLLDNVRLDHTYTVVGSVVDGMSTVDVVLEGAVIERAEVIHPEAVAGM